MSVMMLLKIFSDCCICFAILGSGPVSFSLPRLLPAFICGMGAAIATFFDRKNLSALAGYEVVGFAYPGGGRNFDDRVADLIRNNTGVKYARGTFSTYSFEPQSRSGT